MSAKNCVRQEADCPRRRLEPDTNLISWSRKAIGWPPVRIRQSHLFLLAKGIPRHARMTFRSPQRRACECRRCVCSFSGPVPAGLDATLSRPRLTCSMATADAGRCSGRPSALSGGVPMPGTTEAHRRVLPVSELPVTERTPALTPRGEDASTPGPHASKGCQRDRNRSHLDCVRRA